MLNYKKLMDKNPYVFEEFTNSLGQKITLVEDPIHGDDESIIVVCHELQLAAYSGFWDVGELYCKTQTDDDYKEYEPTFENGRLKLDGEYYKSYSTGSNNTPGYKLIILNLYKKISSK